MDMARTVAALPAGSRITDYISLGVVANTFPASKVRAVLAATERASIRQRDLPAHVMVYYVIALALYMQSSCREVLRCLLEGLRWLDPSVRIKVSGKSGISQARTRLGWEPVQQLHDEVVRPIAVRTTRGAWYRGWLLVSVDGSTLDVADDPANAQACCSARRWQATGPAKSPWPNASWRTCGQACCAWPIETSSALRCGPRPQRVERRRESACKAVCDPVAPICRPAWLAERRQCLA